MALAPVILLGLLSIVASGGGGGGGNGDGPLSYSGNTQAAVISTANASILVGNVIGSGDTAGAIAPASVSTGSSPGNAAITDLARTLATRLRGLGGLRPHQAAKAAIPIDNTERCDSGGSIHMSGTLNDNGTGTLDLSFNSCATGDVSISGDATIRIDAFDMASFEITDATVSFTRLTAVSPDYNQSGSGSIRIELLLSTDSERLTINMVTRDNASDKMLKIENMVVLNSYDDLFMPSSYSETMTGRVYDSVHGYVDVTTPVPLDFSDMQQAYPNPGGQLLLTGADDATILVTAVSGTEVTLALDLDADTHHETSTTMPWTLLGKIPGTNSAPTADAGMDQTISKSMVVTLDGSGSSDPDYNFLSYAWEFAQQPANSQAVLSDTSTPAPSFTADGAGTYVINLVVNDGQENSLPDSVTITSVNDAPVAHAGANQFGGVGLEASLDGSASSDNNGDTLTYSWSFVSLPAGSSTTLVGPTSETPTFIADVEGLYEIRLTVNDGFVDSEADTVIIRAMINPALSCSGDDTTGLAPSGSMMVGPSTDFVPLCNGWLLLGDRTTNSVMQLNAISGAIDATYQLDAAPGDLELDPDNALLYVAQAPATALARIDIIGGQQSSVPLTAPAVNLALGNSGRMLAMLADSATWPLRPLAIVDGLLGTEEKVLTGDYGQLIVYDRPGQQLITGTLGGSPGQLSRYAFDETSLTLTLQQELRGGGNGQDLAISPDGDHIAYPNGGGNGNGYTIYDFSSDDLNAIHGEWNTGAYPASAAFDPFGEYVVATDRSSIKVFSLATHSLIQAFTVDFTGCDYNSISKVGFSRGGKIVYGFSNCGFDDTSGKLFWAVFEP